MKKENVLFIEECFRNIQQEKEVDKNLRLIQSAVKREFNISLEISILDNQKQFFGMCIYPSMNEIELLTMAMMSNGDGKVKFSDLENIHRDVMEKSSLVVEIDSLLLYDHNLNATAGEVTAILLHEIGHIVASNSIVNRMRRAREYMAAKFDHNVRGLMKKIPIMNHLFSLVSLQIFSHQLNIQLVKEKEADELARKEGYGEELLSILNKLIANGKGSQIRKTNKEIDKDVEVTVDWLVVNVKELEYRKNKLNRTLKLMKLTTPSRHLANCIKNISEKIFARLKKEEDKPEFVNEAFLFSNLKDKKMKAPKGAVDSSGRVKRLQTRDLDIYRAELERVHSVDEKIFLIERLHDLLDDAEYALYMVREDPRRVMQSEETINNYIHEIHRLISDTNNKKISKQRYGLYIKYPADYEG
jgi:hypothetical protein